MESRRPLFIGIAAGAVALVLVAAGLVAAAVTGVIPLRASQDIPKLLPADVEIYCAVSVDLQDVAGFKHLRDIYGDLPQVQDAMDELLADIEAGDITWQDDIAPWLGSEVALAVTDLQQAMEGDDPTVMLAAATRKQKESDAFIGKVLAALEEDGHNLEERTHEKVVYTVAQPPSSRDMPVVAGTVGGFVVVTSDVDAMEAIIDMERGNGDSLKENGRYQDMVAALPKNPAGFLFLDLRPLMDAALEAMEDELPGAGLELPGETMDTLEAYQALGLAVTLDSEGVQFDVATTFDPDLVSGDYPNTLGTQASANRILNEIPAEALVVLTAQDLGQGWETIYQTLAGQPGGEQQLRDLGDELGVRLDEEFLSWLTGEFALAIVETPGFELLPVGGFVLSGVDDHEQAQATLADLAEAAEELAGWEFEEMRLGGYEVQALRDPGTAEVLFGLGLSEDRLLLALSGEAMNLVTSGDFATLAEDRTFKAVQGHLPGKIATLGYANLERLLAVATADMLEWERQEYEESIAPMVEPIQAIGLAVEPMDTTAGLTRMVLFVYLP